MNFHMKIHCMECLNWQELVTSKNKHFKTLYFAWTLKLWEITRIGCYVSHNTGLPTHVRSPLRLNLKLVI